MEKKSRRLGKYLLLEPIGRGGMGAVFRAVQQGLEREVAVKVLPEASAGRRPDFIRRFMREASLCSKLSHPNIVKVFDHGFENGLYFYVMELLDATGLEALLREQPVQPMERLIGVARDLLGALAYIHPQGIIHRDIKPSNIMLDREGRAILTDFGLVKDLEASAITRSQEVVGTPVYVAPELLRGEPVTPSTDLYQAGLVLYEMLAGRQPFRGDAPGAVFYQIQSGLLEPVANLNPNVPPRIAEVVMRLAALDSGARPATAAQALAEVEAAFAESAPRRVRPERSASPRKLASPPLPVTVELKAEGAGWPLRVAAGSLALACLVGGLAVSGVLSGSRGPAAPPPVVVAVSPPPSLPPPPPPSVPSVEGLASALRAFEATKRQEALEERLRGAATATDRTRILAEAGERAKVTPLGRLLAQLSRTPSPLLATDLPWAARAARAWGLFELLGYDLLHLSRDGKPLFGILRLLEPELAFFNRSLVKEEKPYPEPLIPSALAGVYGNVKAAVLLDNHFKQDSYSFENSRESYFPPNLREYWDKPSSEQFESPLVPFDVPAAPGLWAVFAAVVWDIDMRSCFLMRLRPAGSTPRTPELCVPLVALIDSKEKSGWSIVSTRLAAGVLPPGRYSGRLTAHRVMSRYFNKPNLLVAWVGFLPPPRTE